MHLLGLNRTGKSSTAENFIREWKLHKQNAGKVFAHNPQNNFKGLVDYEIDNIDETWIEDLFYIKEVADERGNKRFQYFPTKDAKNGLIVLDDYRVLHDQDRPQRWLKVLMNFRAKWGIDIIFICHSPNDILAYAGRFTTDWYIFYIQVDKTGFDRKIPDKEKCEKAAVIMKAFTQEYVPEGDFKKFYPDFPYIHIDTKGGRMTACNIDEQQMRNVLKKKRNEIKEQKEIEKEIKDTDKFLKAIDKGISDAENNK